MMHLPLRRFRRNPFSFPIAVQIPWQGIESKDRLNEFVIRKFPKSICALFNSELLVEDKTGVSFSAVDQCFQKFLIKSELHRTAFDCKSLAPDESERDRNNTLCSSSTWRS